MNSGNLGKPQVMTLQKVTTDSKTYQSRGKVRPSLGRHAVMAALMRLHHPSSRAAGWLTVSFSDRYGSVNEVENDQGGHLTSVLGLHIHTRMGICT